MNCLFFPRERPALISREAAETTILAQRFEGKCSIDAISTLMKRSYLPFSSVGYISEYLSRIGESLPNVLTNTCEPEQFLAFADDEIFAKSAPILITVDPISSAILRIERVNQRSADEWLLHYQSLLDNGFSPDLLTSDAGTALCAAHEKIFPNTPWQSDTFHGVAHRLGGWIRRLEKGAYTAIEEVDKREKTLASAKTEAVIDKRLNRCFTADDAAKQAIELYDNFSYLYRYLIQQLNVFDSKGHLRQYNQVKENMQIALELMETLHHKPLNKAIASIKKALPDLLTYWTDASIAIENCQQLSTDQDVLQTLFLAWQWNKAVIKAKPASRKHRAIEQRQFYLELAELLMGCKEKYLELKENIFEELDQIIQASSMVECINSILRPYLNTSKNQITQAFLNTFMFYHNHRRYHAGKRKGKSPMEILTGKEQKEDWVVLLQKEVNKETLTVPA
ncbi:MAG: hypothetical protein GQ529_06240 [Methyloprofundus sp.]|nr:hypothetical protein [Methyloprofundus sp.]